MTGETVNDLMAADGVRRRPVVKRMRRAVVYVFRGALATQAQMRAYAFWPGSDGQDPLSSYTGAIEVLPR